MLIRFNWKEKHHLYWGVVVWIVANVLDRFGVPFMLAFKIVGVLLVVDDMWQHWRQVKDPNYRSPVWRLWKVINRAR